MRRSIKTIENIRADDTFDVTDYPSCVAFWPVTETSGNTLTDLVGGIVCDYTQPFGGGAASTLSFSGNKATRGAGAGQTGIATSGTMPDLGSTNDFLCFAVVDATGGADALFFGSPVANEDQIALWDTLAALNVVADGSASDAFTTALRDGNTKAVGVYSDRADSKWYYVETDGTTITSPENIAITNATAGIDLGAPAQNGLALPASNIIYGAAIFSFTSVRSDVKSIVSWCNYQWRAGNKVLPPWLKNAT